jgi:hypothetical protein
MSGATQIIRDTLWGGGYVTVSPNITRGEGQPKCHVPFFKMMYECGGGLKLSKKV